MYCHIQTQLRVKIWNEIYKNIYYYVRRDVDVSFANDISNNPTFGMKRFRGDAIEKEFVITGNPALEYFFDFIFLICVTLGHRDVFIRIECRSKSCEQTKIMFWIQQTVLNVIVWSKHQKLLYSKKMLVSLQKTIAILKVCVKRIDFTQMSKVSFL